MFAKLMQLHLINFNQNFSPDIIKQLSLVLLSIDPNIVTQYLMFKLIGSGFALRII